MLQALMHACPDTERLHVTRFFHASDTLHLRSRSEAAQLLQPVAQEKSNQATRSHLKFGHSNARLSIDDAAQFLLC